MPEDAQDAVVNFPKDFMWGASVSAYQVEGGNHNQWTVWELAHASELAKTADVDSVIDNTTADPKANALPYRTLADPLRAPSNAGN